MCAKNDDVHIDWKFQIPYQLKSHGMCVVSTAAVR